MSQHTESQPDLSPRERRRQLIEDQLQRARRRLEELRREDFESDRAFREAQLPRQRHVWQLEEDLSHLDG